MFLNFRVANNHLKYSSTQKQCQSNLLREEVCQKKCTVRSLQKEFSSPKSPLQNKLNLIDFALDSPLFFGINNKILKSKSLLQQKRFYYFVHENKTKNDPEKVIFNFSKYQLSDAEKKLLAKGFKFQCSLNYFTEISIIQRFCLMRT